MTLAGRGGFRFNMTSTSDLVISATGFSATIAGWLHVKRLSTFAAGVTPYWIIDHRFGICLGSLA